MKYRVGQKVVYIGPDYRNHPLVIRWKGVVPVPRSIYTVRGSTIISGGPYAGLPGYYVDEIINPITICPVTGICGEALSIDEPLLRPLTDISRFHEIRKAVEARDMELIRDKVRA